MIHGLRVLDRTVGIAGPYCTKLLADAGADVVKVEPPGGDPLRTWRSGGLFEYLNASKRSVQGDDRHLVASAEVVVTDVPADGQALHVAEPELVVVSISPFGADGPWSDRPATELTLQAACGSLGSRGLPELPPVPAGGRIGEWMTGTYAAVATLAAVTAGGGRHIDVAMFDCMAVSLVTYPSVFASFSGWPSLSGTGRVIEVPSIEPTKDGFVVFTTNSAQQFQDFLVLIGRPDWLEDRGLARVTERFARRGEFLDAVHRYTRARTSDQCLEEAARLRIPAGPVLHGATVAEHEQFAARAVFEPSPNGRFRQPRPPYRISGTEPPAPTLAPAAGADTGTVRWPARERFGPRGAVAPGPGGSLPLSGLQVLDCTAWWAGPAATHVLACLGADVIKVESARRPDMMRFSSTKAPDASNWWEWGAIFHGVNVSKRGVTIDLGCPEGVELFGRLARQADVIVENYTPRVMEHFGLGWETLHSLNPALVMVRMPAFGLDGPWRDRTGFAQTMESMSGMAWVTGFPDGAPVLPRGPCDPLAGLHAALATLLALRARAADGAGRLVEATMVEAALNAAAEQVIEWDAAGTLLGREGARGGVGAPQGVYRCGGTDSWIAIAVASDQQWEALRKLIGLDARPQWEKPGGRRGDGDLDELISRWCADQDAERLDAALGRSGIPSAVVVSGRDVARNPQLRHRGLFETEDHPVTGRHEIPTMPFRFSGVTGWLHRPAPTLGQHNDEVLGKVASAEELADWREKGVIGERLVDV